MTDGQHEDEQRPQPNFDELESKRFGRLVRRATQYREELFSRDPDSPVELNEAAAILDLDVEEVTAEMDAGELGFIEVRGERIVRVADVRARFERDTQRLKDFAESWTRLRSELDWDE